MVTMVGDNIIELRRLFTDYQAFDKKLPLRFEMRLANSRFTAFSPPRRGLSLALCGWALCSSGVARFGGAGGWWQV